MKISILKNQLNEAIQHVSKAISSKTTIPILTGIKLDVTHYGVTLTASDIETVIQATIPATDNGKEVVKVEEIGSVVLPAKFFVEIIKKLPKDTVDIEVLEGFSTIIQSGKSKVNMVGLDPEEYPALPAVDDDQAISVPGSLIKQMIRSTGFSVSANETSPILTGVLWSLIDGQLKLLATDRHRLASTQSALEEDITIHDVTISGKTLGELNKIIPDNDEAIEIVVADSQVLFKVGNVLFYSRILDGTFPDTSKIIPTEFKTELVLDTKKLTESIDRAFLLAREEKTNIVRLEASGDGEVRIESTSSGVGKVIEQLEAVDITGEPIRISFNSKYMLDVLKVIESDKIHIGFTGTMSPIIIKPVDDSQSLYLILPYRTSN
ncbi:DNA polymerase III subunit beta [Paenibacillus anaericanus]|uniref:Beta sliding clamp n=1 Tax=Paenibacillus anaericanus TaxID=170367 RepID=A0A3S1BS88_9BACL|nr:DNA polymerase III subunit beta [Paenibacillus anaericanus]RUT48555.1 DNA polymerase III subunit beta [Paenibacillus anaericanus]